MRINEKINLGIFFAILVMVILWIRYNLDFMRVILESSTLFFQLMVAVLVIAVIRNIIGIKTYGVFGPAIIIFGVLKSGLGLFMGLVVFFNIFIVAMLISLVLYPLKISSSYRVAIIISSVISESNLISGISTIPSLSVLSISLGFCCLDMDNKPSNCLFDNLTRNL